MTLEIFISILVLSASATSIGIEIVKKMLNAFGKQYKTMPMAIIIAFCVGVLEIIIYDLNTSGISYATILYCLSMGISNAVSATVGYDQVKAFLLSLFGTVK